MKLRHKIYKNVMVEHDGTLYQFRDGILEVDDKLGKIFLKNSNIEEFTEEDKEKSESAEDVSADKDKDEKKDGKGKTK